MTHTTRRAALIRRLQIRATLIASTMALTICGTGLAIGFALPSDTKPAPFIIEAIDASGEAWGAGAGDTCAEAMQGAVMPADVVSVRCVRL